MDDVKYMQIALELAAKGKGYVEPNPMVGCVIVRDGEIIGKGFHELFGGAHAEVNALADCKAKGNDPAGAAMYVTLEPCSHYGKTGPCADAVVENEIGKVVIAAVDTSEHVGGKGIARIEQEGIEVVTGVCEKEALRLNPGFYKFAETGLPWVVLKWAQSEDGYLAYKDSAKHGQWISNEASRKDANFYRRSMQGILVGVNTVKQDDPQLTVRSDDGCDENIRQPLRIVLDSKLSVPLDAKLMDTNIAATLIVTTQQAYEANAEKVNHIRTKGPDVIAIKESDGRCDLNELLNELGKRNVQQLLVEGGAEVLEAFYEQNLADEIRVYIAPKKLGEFGAVPISKKLAETIKTGMKAQRIEIIEGDKKITGLFVK